VIPWSPAERISAPFSTLILLIRAVLKESRRLNVAVIHVDLFVNNAGFSLSGEFLSHDPRQEQASRKQSGQPGCEPNAQSCRADRRDRNGQYGSPSLMVLCRRGHSGLSPFGVGDVVRPVSVRQADFKSMCQLPSSPQPRAPQRSQCGVEKRSALPLPLF